MKAMMKTGKKFRKWEEAGDVRKRWCKWKRDKENKKVIGETGEKWEINW